MRTKGAAEAAARRALPAVVAVALLWAPRAAQACALCMSGRNDETRLAFILTTALLTTLPLLLVGGLVWWLRRRAREIERPRAPALHSVSRTSS